MRFIDFVRLLWCLLLVCPKQQDVIAMVSEYSSLSISDDLNWLCCHFVFDGLIDFKAT